MRARKNPNNTEKNTSASNLVLAAASTMLGGTTALDGVEHAGVGARS